jgi:soluble lytic murein transglycosylase-like protein
VTRSKRNILLLGAGLLIGGLLALPVLEQLHAWRTARQMARHDALIREHAAAAELPYELVRAVVEAESGGDPRAESELGAKGLMQIMPLTEQDVLARNPDLAGRAGNLADPAYNLAVGTTYLRHLHKRFGGDRTLMLTAYHMGPTRVAKLLKRHPGLTPTQLLKRHAGPKTRAYVAQVLRRAAELDREADPPPNRGPSAEASSSGA